MEVEFWHWLALGTVLLILEILSGSMILLWPALAALAVGAIAAAEPMAWYYQVVLFSTLSVLSTFTGRYWWRRRVASDRPTLNRPGSELIGRRIALEEAIERGRGRALIDGVWWQVRAERPGAVSEDAAEVEVVGIDGATLVVSAGSGRGPTEG